MHRIVIGCFMFASAAAFADVPHDVNRQSPSTIVTTTKTSDEFATCVAKAAFSEFPATRVEPEKTGKVISIIRAPAADAVAVMDVEEGEGKGAMVTIRTASRGQPGQDPAVKLARNCQSCGDADGSRWRCSRVAG